MPRSFDDALQYFFYFPVLGVPYVRLQETGYAAGIEMKYVLNFAAIYCKMESERQRNNTNVPNVKENKIYQIALKFCVWCHVISTYVIVSGSQPNVLVLQNRVSAISTVACKEKLKSVTQT